MGGTQLNTCLSALDLAGSKVGSSRERRRRKQWKSKGEKRKEEREVHLGEWEGSSSTTVITGVRDKCADVVGSLSKALAIFLLSH